MSKSTPKFTIKELHKLYPTDDKCLEAIWQGRYGSLTKCPVCKRETTFHKIKSKPVYSCKFCGHQISPLAGTIFHKSHVPLTLWFELMFEFAISKNGISAKEIERRTGVANKTALRMGKRIRLLFSHSGDILANIVEVDETYMGGTRRGKRGRGAEGKVPVVGLVERKGKIVAKVTADTKSKTVMPLIKQSILAGSKVVTDEYRSYNKIARNGYDHQTVQHATKQYAIGDIHTNTIENFWGQLKRSVNGTFHAVSPAYLQAYVDEFAYRYNYRTSDQHIFHLMLSEAVKLGV
jgi:transposase-like protein